MHEALAAAFEHGADALDLDRVDADGNDHAVASEWLFNNRMLRYAAKQ